MDNEEIEIILDEDEEKELIEKQNNKNKKKKENKKKKLTKGQKIFLLCNIFIIIGIIAFYGYRLIHYYKIEHAEPEKITLKDKLTKMDNIVYKDDGLYEKDHKYYFKGTNVNNYLFYQGRIYRIISIDNGIKIINNDILTNLVWQKEIGNYEKSMIHNWLSKYIDTIDTKDLLETTWCDNKIDINNYQCNNTYKDKIGLLSTEEYLKAGGKNSYLNNGDFFWTINYDNDGNAYYINNEGSINNINKTDDNYFSYGIRDVLVLKEDVPYLNGDGSLETPYTINEDMKELLKDNNIMSYVTYKDYLFRIIDKDDKGTTLILDDTLEDEKNYNEIDKYLNEFKKSLNEKDLVEQDVITNEYNFNNNYDYTKVIKTEKKLIRIPHIGEIMFTSGNNFWLNTITDSKQGLIYTVDESKMFFADLKNNKHLVKPIIKLRSDIEVSGGLGSIDIPLIIEDEGE